jgi:adenosylmethionine-8-amino-7-oxononanoate aminotransferase
VKDKATKEKWARDSAFIQRMHALVTERRMLTRVWELLHIAPPLIVTREEIDRIVAILDDSLTIAEREFGYT